MTAKMEARFGYVNRNVDKWRTDPFSLAALPPSLTPAGGPIVWRGCGKPGSMASVSDVTRVIEAIQRGDPKAAEELLPLVYDELRRLAAFRMANEAAGHTLQPTALVHEAWLRLVGNENQRWNGRAHFFAAAAAAK